MPDDLSMAQRHRLNWKSTYGLIVKHREHILLAVIVMLAFIVRYIGLKFSYPLLTHTDEPNTILPVFTMGLDRNLDAGIPHRPDLVMIYVNFFLLNIVSLLRFGDFFSNTYPGNAYDYFVVARLVVVVIGSIMPILAWKIGQKTRLNFGIPAAVFVAFFPSYVVHSHYSTPDIPLTFLTLLVMLLAINYAQSGNQKMLLLATFTAALNIAEKYPGLISFALIAFSILVFEWSRRSRFDIRLIFAVLKQTLVQCGFLLLFLYLIAPTLFIQYGRTLDAIVYQSRSTHLGADNLGWAGNLAFYAVEYFKAGNWLLTLLIIPGIIYGIKRREPVLLFMLYGVFYWIVLSVLALHWERWALPMYTAPLLIGAYGAAAIGKVNWLRPRLRSIAKYTAVAAVGITLFVTAFSHSVRLTYMDTRVKSLEYCTENGISETNTLFEGYSPYSPTLGVGAITPERLNGASGVEYIILSSSMYGRYYAEPDRYAEQIAVYERIRADQELIAEFSQDDKLPLRFLEQLDADVYYVRRFFGEDLPVRLTGPTIQIFRVVKPLF